MFIGIKKMVKIFKETKRLKNIEKYSSSYESIQKEKEKNLYLRTSNICFVLIYSRIKMGKRDSYFSG